MSKIGNLRLELTVGLHSVRSWLEYGYAVSDEDSAKLIALEGSITRLKEEAAEVEQEEGEIFASVVKDVELRFKDWVVLDGEVADNYIERTKEMDATTLKEVEDAYADEDNKDVTSEDIAYTRIYTSMLDYVFELRRLQYACQRQTEQHTVYEDAIFEGAKHLDDIEEFTIFMPTEEEATEAILTCVKALNDKYVHGDFPSGFSVKISLGTLTPDDEAGCVSYMKKLDALLAKEFNFADDMARIYHAKFGNREDFECPEYTVGM